jgi:hypothetical protein
LLILADAGGSNGYRSRLWKARLHQLAVQTGLHISVCHFPPGTSKWNKIEHRMFCHITENWRGQPLISHEVIIPTDRRHDHEDRVEDPRSPGQEAVSDRGQDLPRRTAPNAHQAGQLPWRLELHHSSCSRNLIMLFARAS